jgi:hypothetical protein
MTNILISWKTSIFGLLLVIGGIFLLTNNRIVEGSMCLTAGCGLFNAKDSGVTGVGSSAKTEDKIKS